MCWLNHYNRTIVGMFDVTFTTIQSMVCYICFADRTSDITQVAVCCDEKFFSRYIMPTKPIDAEATNVTGLHMQNGRLCLNGTPLETTTCFQALVGLMEFLRSLGPPVVLRQQ